MTRVAIFNKIRILSQKMCLFCLIGYDKKSNMLETVLSQNKIPVRLTDERWAHITEEHCELAGMRLEILETIAKPYRILEGGDGELLAVREIEKDSFRSDTSYSALNT